MRGVTVLLCSVGLVAACTTSKHTTDQSTTTLAPSATMQTDDQAKADAIMKIVNDYKNEAHLKAVIVRVTQDGKNLVTAATGESMTGVPATVDMHFRNGAVAISYVSTLLLELVDEHKLSLDDKLAKYLPNIPHADEVTLGQLAQMTSGYHDFVIGNQAFGEELLKNPYKAWTTDEQLSYALDKPLWYPPGTNWDYAHTNYVLLGLVLSKVTGKSLADALQEKVLGPLGLKNTKPNLTAEIPQPVLHAFSGERRALFGSPPGLYEESTYWNPSWTLSQGAIETSNIYDLEASAVAVGTGKLLTPQSYKLMTSPDLRGKTTAIPGCVNCRPMTEAATYGLGVWISGDWLLQNPLFFGYAAVNAYLPKHKIGIAVAVTYEPEAFGPDGSYTNGGQSISSMIGAYLAPDDPPPTNSSHN